MRIMVRILYIALQGCVVINEDLSYLRDSYGIQVSLLIPTVNFI